MSLESCYEACGGDLAAVRAHLLTDERIVKFVKMFQGDTTFESLKQAMESQDHATAFRCAHTLKGVSRDLGFTPLGDAAVELTEALRPNADGEPADLAAAQGLYETARQHYTATIDAITNAEL